MIELGSRVRDRITKYSGIAVTRADYINGCVCYEVEAERLQDGKPITEVWFDEQRLEIIHDSDDVKSEWQAKNPRESYLVGGTRHRPPKMHPPPG